MSKLGRPRALDEIKRREVLAILSHGCSLTDAASYVDCSPSTIRREAARNPDFQEDLKKATMGVQLRPLDHIRNASEKDWRAAAWLLERINPDRFAKPDKKSLGQDEVTLLIDSIVELMAAEIDDPAIQQRIYQTLLAKAEEITHEFLATDRSRTDVKNANILLDKK